MGATLKVVKAGDKSWEQMNGNEKVIFVVKVCIMVCSFGFIFANVIAP